MKYKRAGVIYLMTLPEASAINGTTVMADDGYTSFKGVDGYQVPVFTIDENARSETIVKNLVKQARRAGVSFDDEKGNGLSDSSPYYIMIGGSSLSYRKNQRKWPEKGIVIFATDRDAEQLQSRLGLHGYDNSSDAARPHAIFVPVEQLDQAFKVIAENQQTGEGLERERTVH